MMLIRCVVHFFCLINKNYVSFGWEGGATFSECFLLILYCTFVYIVVHLCVYKHVHSHILCSCTYQIPRKDTRVHVTYDYVSDFRNCIYLQKIVQYCEAEIFHMTKNSHSLEIFIGMTFFPCDKITIGLMTWDKNFIHDNR